MDKTVSVRFRATITIEMRGGRKNMLEIVEAIYRDEPSERVWLEGILEAARPSLDRGAGLIGIPFEARPAGLHVPWVKVLGAPGVKPSFITAVLATTRDDSDLSRVYRAAACQTGVEAGMTRKPGWKMLKARGIVDFLAVNGVDTTGHGTCIGALLPGVTRIDPVVRRRFERVAAHLGVGQRYRRLAKRSGRKPEAIFDANAKLLHAEAEATTREAREVLKRSVLAIERARGKQRRTDPDGALLAWKGLVDARWSLVDEFESDGKRFIVARENEPLSPRVAALTKRERQIVGYLAMGHTSKLVAYELGIADATVRVLIHRAMQKLQVETRDALVAAYVAQASADASGAPRAG